MGSLKKLKRINAFSKTPLSSPRFWFYCNMAFSIHCLGFVVLVDYHAGAVPDGCFV
jgi:hypothetical protein